MNGEEKAPASRTHSKGFANSRAFPSRQRLECVWLAGAFGSLRQGESQIRDGGYQ